MNLPVRLSDFFVLYRRIKDKGARTLLIKTMGSKEKRIKSSWSHTTKPASGWWDIDAVTKRIQLKVTGDHEMEIQSYFLKKYAAGAQNLRALSLGCGTGGRELAWARSGQFRRIDAFDVSDTRINKAVSNAQDAELAGILNFFVGDAKEFPFSTEQYDLIIAEGILHHLTPLGDIMEKMREGLKPNGYLVVNDFVGPSRFQWTDRQLEIVNALHRLLPRRFRRRYDGSIKRKVYRPGWLSVWLSDPSEAAESSHIVANLRQFFSVLEIRDYGGTILHLLLKDIVHNFMADDTAVDRLLRLCFEIEDVLLDSKEIESDYKFIVCRNKPRRQS